MSVIFTALSDDAYTLSDGIVTFDVDVSAYPESSPYDASSLMTANGANLTSIVKKGTGAVSLGTSSTLGSFAGSIEVEADGGFLMGWKSCFGKPTSVTVGDGGAVVFTETARVAEGSFANTKFYIAGEGPDGYGALQRPYARWNIERGYLKDLTLNGDATFNVGSRWGLKNGNLTMNNHTLTISCEKDDGTLTSSSEKMWAHVFDLNGTVTVRHPGEIVVGTGSHVSFDEANAQLLKDAADSNGTVADDMTITMRDGACVRIVKTPDGALPCRLVAEGTSKVWTLNNDVSPTDRERYSWWNGPVEIAGTSLVLGHYNEGVVASNASVILSRPVTGGGRLVRNSRGYTFLTGTHTNIFGSLEQTYIGVTTFKGGTTVHLTNSVGSTASFVGSAETTSPPMLVLDGGAKLLCRAGADNTSMLNIGGSLVNGTLGGNGNNCYGAMTIKGGAVVSNDVSVGWGGRGAVYLLDGELDVLKSSNTREQCSAIGYGASGNYGYIGIDGGTFRNFSWFYCGSGAPGFIVQRAGEAFHSSGLFRLGRSGTTSYSHRAQLGGTSTWRNCPVVLNFNGFNPNATWASGVLTVAGTDTVMDMTGTHIMSVATTNASSPVLALVNLNAGGTLKVDYIERGQRVNSTSPAWDSIKSLVANATKDYLNFNGGVLVTTRAGEFWHENASSSDEARLFARATVYAGGATIDTDGRNVTWRMPLDRPYGHGIKSITLPAAACATNALLGPSRCFITSTAGGVAGDALMDFDDTNRVARGMIVTSPGFGYEAAPTVKVAKIDTTSSFDACTVETVDFDAADYVHGGLTKRGAGTLTVTCTNTYGGATRLEGGTLSFTHEQGYPGGDLEIAAAAVQGSLAAPLLTAHTLSFVSGKGVRVTEADTLDADTFGVPKTVATFATPLSAVPSLTLVASDGTAVDSGVWQLLLRSGGTELAFGPMRGTVLIVR